MVNEKTVVGSPVVRKNAETGLFEIIEFGNVTRKFATGFKTIEDVGTWVERRDGALGACKKHEFIGLYRECSLPERIQVSVGL